MERFQNYLRNREYAENTVYAYSNAINRISNHMSELRGDSINLYNLYDIPRLEKIKDTYDVNGDHSDVGYEGHGTVRNAIRRFVEFRKERKNKIEVDLSDNLLEEQELVEEHNIQEDELKDIRKNQEEIDSVLESLNRRICYQEIEVEKYANYRKTLIFIQLIFIFIVIIIVSKL